MNISHEVLHMRLEEEINLTRNMISPARDFLYMCPSIEWVKDFAKDLAAMDHPTYAYEKWDCDDFAFWASLQASNARAESSIADSGHTVLIAYVTLNKSVLGINVEGALEHACLLILTSDADWVLLEPQTGVIKNAKQVLYDDDTRPTCVVTYVIM